MPRIVHFEIPADNPQRAMKFYADVFGWKSDKWPGPEDYWLVTTGAAGEPGINGGLMKKRDPAQPVVNTIDVPSIDDYTARVTKSGGTIVVPKQAVPGVGWLAYFKDTEGNITGLMQNDPSAK